MDPVYLTKRLAAGLRLVTLLAASLSSSHSCSFTFILAASTLGRVTVRNRDNSS